MYERQNEKHYYIIVIYIVIVILAVEYEIRHKNSPTRTKRDGRSWNLQVEYDKNFRNLPHIAFLNLN